MKRGQVKGRDYRRPRSWAEPQPLSHSCRCQQHRGIGISRQLAQQNAGNLEIPGSAGNALIRVLLALSPCARVRPAEAGPGKGRKVAECHSVWVVEGERCYAAVARWPCASSRCPARSPPLKMALLAQAARNSYHPAGQRALAGAACMQHGRGSATMPRWLAMLHVAGLKHG